MGDVHCRECGHPPGADEECLHCRAREVARVAGEELAVHAERVARLARALADALALDRDLRREIEAAALLHDVGKAAIPRRVLTKPAALDDEEWELMRTHTIAGERMVADRTELPASIGRVVRWTHERWDGGGYPDGLSGDDIPLAARVVFCADAYDAMTTTRPYRAALAPEEAVAQLRQGAGRQFDPVVADVLAQLVEEGVEQAA